MKEYRSVYLNFTRVERHSIIASSVARFIVYRSARAFFNAINRICFNAIRITGLYKAGWKLIKSRMLGYRVCYQAARSIYSENDWFLLLRRVSTYGIMCRAAKDSSNARYAKHTRRHV